MSAGLKTAARGRQTAQPEVFNETGNQKKEEKLLFNHSFFSALLGQYCTYVSEERAEVRRPSPRNRC